jgi:DedD protein
MASSRGHRQGGFGKAKLMGFAAALSVLLAGTFLLGVLVGREWGRTRLSMAREAEKKPIALAKTEVQDRSGPMREKLTFYQTLPAPLSSPSREGAKKTQASAKGGEQKSATAAKPELPRAASPSGNGATTRESGSASPPPGSQFWTVQVSAYRSRGLADELNRSLRAAGYDAYLVQVASDDGKSRYRVRVGSYASRVEAERVAERLKTERSLAPFVTLKNP